MGKWQIVLRVAKLLVVIAVILLLAGGAPPLGAAAGAPKTLASLHISGPVRVIDGDTIVVGDVRVRLSGIDTPELGETCRKGRTGTGRCGDLARQFLSDLLSEVAELKCRIEGADRYRRVVATCWTDDKAMMDLAVALVLAGMARPVSRYDVSGGQYGAAELRAQALGKGFWSCLAGTPASWAKDKARLCS